MLRRSLALLLFLLGLAVFLVRLRHVGPYFLPEGGNLLGGIGALVCGGILFGESRIRARGVRIAASLLLGIASVLSGYLALYATLAELEEVVVVRARCQGDAGDSLRFWIVEDDGALWISMGAGKADRTGLSRTRAVSLLRDGQEQCMDATLVADDETLRRVLPLLEEKYTVARIAVSLGIFGDNRYSTNTLLRLVPEKVD